MRKFSQLFLSFVCIAISSVSAMANVYPVNRVFNQNGKFFVEADSATIEVSPLIYKIVEDAPQNFQIVQYGDVRTIFESSALTSPTTAVFEVMQVTLQGDKVVVAMTNGYEFSDPNLNWLAVQKGQKVQIDRYFGLTKEITLFNTVPRETEVSGDLAAMQAQAESHLDEQIRLIEAKRVEAAKLMANENAKKKDVPVNTGTVKLSFSRR